MLRTTLMAAALFYFGQTCIAQHTITASFTGTGVFSAGTQLKYTYTSYGVQFGPYVSLGLLTHLGDELSFEYFPNEAGFPLMNVYGVCVNSKPNLQKDISSYFGGSVEYMSTKANGTKELRKLLIGCQYGINARLARQMFFNADMGLRAGITEHEQVSRSPGGALRIEKKKYPVAYFPVSIGISYVFGKPARK